MKIFQILLHFFSDFSFIYWLHCRLKFLMYRYSMVGCWTENRFIWLIIFCFEIKFVFFNKNFSFQCFFFVVLNFRIETWVKFAANINYIEKKRSNSKGALKKAREWGQIGRDHDKLCTKIYRQTQTTRVYGCQIRLKF